MRWHSQSHFQPVSNPLTGYENPLNYTITVSEMLTLFDQIFQTWVQWVSLVSSPGFNHGLTHSLRLKNSPLVAILLLFLCKKMLAKVDCNKLVTQKLELSSIFVPEDGVSPTHPINSPPSMYTNRKSRWIGGHRTEICLRFLLSPWNSDSFCFSALWENLFAIVLREKCLARIEKLPHTV